MFLNDKMVRLILKQKELEAAAAEAEGTPNPDYFNFDVDDIGEKKIEKVFNEKSLFFNLIKYIENQKGFF